DVERLLDLAKSRSQRRAEERVHAAVQHFARGAEALFAIPVARPEGTDQDVALCLVEIGLAGQQPLQDRADATDFLNRFVRDVNDGLHGRGSPWVPEQKRQQKANGRVRSAEAGQYKVATTRWKRTKIVAAARTV